MRNRIRELVRRNPFLSRAGFDHEEYEELGEEEERGRNPFLSRAGFDIYTSIFTSTYKKSQSLFK